MHCDSDLGFLNSRISAALMSAKTGFCVLANFINQVSAQSLKEVISCACQTSMFVMFFAVHTASHRNQNCSGSSDPVPLKTGSLISSSTCAIVDQGGGGGGGLSEVDSPATRLLGLGLLSDCDGFSGIIDLHCGVVGGFLTKEVSSDLEYSSVF